MDVGKDIVSHCKHSDLSTNALLEQKREINPSMKPIKVIQTSSGVLSDCRLWSRTSPPLEQRPLRNLDVLSTIPSALGLIWRGRNGNDALHKVLSALRWRTPSPALDWEQNFSLYRCMKVSTFFLTFHATFLSETQALILLGTTKCTHFMTLFCCSVCMPRLIGVERKNIR